MLVTLMYRSTVLRCAGTTCVVDQRLTLTSLSNSVIPPGACWTLRQRAVLRNSQKTWGGQRMGIGIIDGYPSSLPPTGFQRGSLNHTRVYFTVSKFVNTTIFGYTPLE